MKIIQHADCFEARSDHGTFVRRFPFDDNARRRTTSKRMSRKQAFQAAKNCRQELHGRNGEVPEQIGILRAERKA